MLAASDLFSGAPQGINYLSSLARDKERSLETNSAQFLNNFHTLHPWSNFKPQVTMWINSNDQGYFWKAINISLLKKWGENTFTKWSFQWLGAGLGTVKSSLDPALFSTKWVTQVQSQCQWLRKHTLWRIFAFFSFMQGFSLKFLVFYSWPSFLVYRIPCQPLLFWVSFIVFNLVSFSFSCLIIVN